MLPPVWTALPPAPPAPAPRVEAASARREVLALRVASGRRLALAVEEPDARASFATMSRATKGAGQRGPGGAEAEVRWSVTSDVIVGPTDAGAIAAALGDLGLGRLPVRAVPEVEGFFAIDAGTIRRAQGVAEALSPRAELGSVSADAAPRPVRRSAPTDPLLAQQWHLRNTLLPIADVNADGAWNLGYTGAGVTIGITEGGWHETHPDLAPNYVPEASQYVPAGGNGYAHNHGTACAGVAAAAPNGAYGVGLAFNAGLSEQIAFFDGQPLSTATTAAAFAFRNDLNDIKSNSWGPDDVGIIWEASPVEMAALEQGALTGRGGLGTVFVWAGGNGAWYSDRVDYDPLASSRYTIAVAAIGDGDYESYYSEPGSSVLVAAHSNGNDRGITTTWSSSSTTSDFGGTSSAAPLVAGAVALALEANPNLTWRDVQHVLVNSARKNDPNDSDWKLNGAGRWVNHKFGFGAVDAAALVAEAAAWTSVGPEVTATTGPLSFNIAVPDNNAAGVSVPLHLDADIRIESVELVLSIDSTYIGDLEISLTAPSGTRSVFATSRWDSQHGLSGHVFTSVRHWDESSAGTWTLHLADRGPQDLSVLRGAELRVHGTAVEACAADWDGSGAADVNDLLAFLGAFRNGEADFDGSGGVDVNDLLGFLGAFRQGCGTGGES